VERAGGDRDVKLAFIGASHWHLPLYLEPALAVPGARIVGISDPDAGFVAAWCEKLGCSGDTDFRDLCRRARPDFVFALGRHVDMADEARFLIEEGIPFAIEKPCGLDHAEVAELAGLEARHGSFSSVPLVFRNGDFAARLAEMGADTIQYMTWRFIAGFASRYQQAGCEWMLDPLLAGGGCTINLGVHFFDLCLSLFGDDVRVRQAAMSNAAWRHPVEDYSAVTLERGADLCVIETGYLYPAPTSMFDMHFAVRSRNHYLVARDPQTVEIVDHAGRREMLTMATTNVPHYRTYVGDVLERLREGRPPLARLADMVPVMRLVGDAYAKAGALAVQAAVH
jgi:predicted dehydrogenase